MIQKLQKKSGLENVKNTLYIYGGETHYIYGGGGNTLYIQGGGGNTLYIYGRGVKIRSYGHQLRLWCAIYSVI